MTWTWVSVAAIGLGIGFLGGLFGKGGSAVATPLLHLAGLPAMIALASPLPATIPSTLSAADRYRRAGLLDRRIIAATAATGVPATIVGAVVSRWVGGDLLVRATELLLVVIGARLLLSRSGQADSSAPEAISTRPNGPTDGDPVVASVGSLGSVGAVAVTARTAGTRTAPTDRVARPHPVADASPTSHVLVVGLVAGLAAGLLANSGGFLLAPLFLGALKLPIKPALGTSLALSALLAVPGTIVHAALGHIDWSVALVLAVCAIPASRLGATVALSTPSDRLERLFGAGLLALGLGLLIL